MGFMKMKLPETYAEAAEKEETLRKMGQNQTPQAGPAPVDRPFAGGQRVEVVVTGITLNLWDVLCLMTQVIFASIPAAIAAAFVYGVIGRMFLGN